MSRRGPYSLIFSDARPVVVTGAAGFIARALIREIETLGFEVVRVDRGGTGGAIACDVLSTDFPPLLAKVAPSYVFHLAGNAYVPPSVDDPHWDLEANGHTTIAVLEAVRALPQPPAVVYTSSAAVYGNPRSNPIAETAELRPISPYGVSKLAGERYLAAYSEMYGIRTASARIFSCYGPGQKKQVVYDLIARLLLKPDRLDVLGDGTQARDFVFVDDVATALLYLAANASSSSPVYNVGTGITTSIHDLVGQLCRLTGVDSRVQYSGSVRAGDPQRWESDPTQLSALGWEPSVTLGDGLAQTVEWVLDNMP